MEGDKWLEGSSWRPPATPRDGTSAGRHHGEEHPEEELPTTGAWGLWAPALNFAVSTLRPERSTARPRSPRLAPRSPQNYAPLSAP